MERYYRYTPKSVEDAGFKKILDEIIQCGNRFWNEKNKEKRIRIEGEKYPIFSHPEYLDYSILDFCHFYDFLELKIGYQFVAFQKVIDKDPNQLWGTFYHGQHRVISPLKIQMAMCTAAQFLEIELILLIAEFLEDCEIKKIRLFFHAKYEEAIICFLREAPQIVAQLQSKPSQQSQLNNNKETSFETTNSENIIGVERIRDKTKWLDPNNYDALPLVGRAKENERLDAFINHEDLFKVWGVEGPSGSGKTRLVSQWAYYSPALKNWKRLFLHKENRNPAYWDSWTPSKPTLIIIDYMFGYEEVISKLMIHRLQSKQSIIRLLVIDHVFSESFIKDRRWDLDDNEISLNQNEKYFYDSKALDLKQTDSQEEIIREIIKYRAQHISDHQLDEAHKYLKNMQGAYNPLFAALIGDAINSNSNFEELNRRQLMDYYLSGSDRLPWNYSENEDKNAITKKLIASYFIAAATARGEMKYEDLFKVARTLNSAPKNFGGVKKICQTIISEKNKDELNSFKPDILGESFFLKFLQFLEESPEYLEEFRQIFMAGNEDTQTKDSLELIAFIRRLTRNLLNDDQQNIDTKSLWNTLLKFLNPLDFENSESLNWAMTIALIHTVEARQDHLSKDEVNNWLNKIKASVLCQTNNKSLLLDSVEFYMRYYELTHESTNITSRFSKEIISLFNNFTTFYRENNGLTPIKVAGDFGFSKIIQALLSDPKTNLKISNSDYRWALYGACLRGHTETVRILIDNEAITPRSGLTVSELLIVASDKDDTDMVKLLLNKGAKFDAVDYEWNTALTSASGKGYIETIKLLLDNGADIEAADNNGCTALVSASACGKIEAVSLLLDKGANVNGTKSYSHALVSASRYGYIDIVRLLLDRGAKLEATINGSCPSLLEASESGQTDTVNLLMDRGAKINASGYLSEATALILASSKGHTNTAELLLNKGAKINAIDKDKCTALILASSNGHTDTVMLLLRKKAKINVADIKKYTALTKACENGHTGAVKLLLENGAKINAAAFILAGKNGHTDIIELLLEKGANINAVDEEKRTALILASGNWHIDTVRLLLEKGAKIDALDQNQQTALIWASSKWRDNVSANYKAEIETIKLLLDIGAYIEAADNNKCTALIEASSRGHINAVRLLIERGAKINAINKNKCTSLILASGNWRFDTVRLLLEKGAKIDAVDQNQQTALMWACNKRPLTFSNYNAEINTIKLLLESGALIETVDNNKYTALIWASIKGRSEAAKLLLEKGAKIDAVENNGCNALMFASLNGHTNTVKLLLEKGANINAVDNYNRTALMFASTFDPANEYPINNNHLNTVSLLLEQGAKIDIVDSSGRTALIVASEHGHHDTVRLLINEGAKIEAGDVNNSTALMYAAIKGRLETVRILLTSKAMIEAVDNEGRTALMYASTKGHTDIVRLLIDSGAKIEATDNEGLTTLMYASAKGQAEIVGLLLNEKAQIEATDNKRFTALMWACQRNQIVVVKLLLKQHARIDVVDNNGQTALSISKTNEYNEIVQLLVDHGA